jgi:hypothetical protein
MLFGCCGKSQFETCNDGSNEESEQWLYIAITPIRMHYGENLSVTGRPFSHS